MRKIIIPLILLWAVSAYSQHRSGEEAKGSRSYNDYEKPETCASCHTSIYRQWRSAMMSQSYTHHWDEIEYFDLAVEHAKKDPSLKEVVDGCNGCHAPLAYLAGDIPPPRPSEGSRANEGVSCDLCHTITGVDEDPPVNFSWISEPGRTKYGSKPGLESPHHITEYNELFTKTELCGSCHNEKNPYGIWVKSTQIEWKEGPYSSEGVKCFDCHMPKARGRSAKMAEEGIISQHIFLGAHKPAKLRGAIELSMHALEPEVPYDGTAVIKVELFNAKAGHKIPTGSVEDRILWLELTAVDEDGKEYNIPVDRKGFKGEEFTIGTDESAYVDMGIPLGKPDFKGVPREQVQKGSRIFRMPYLDKNGVMTIMQWNTRKLGVDYRIGPRETKVETYSWTMPDDIAFGKVRITATLNYRKLIKPVAEYLGVPAEESEIDMINQTSAEILVYD
ncbi:MAG TPA: multiheme c-type cytochrome [Candidatus Krumholzibacteriaceae bacterium]|nr:multiheme c-type cytochrome [Candidatus Krumholzibacteriaceae bacterium]